jgi:hypothetical protein
VQNHRAIAIVLAVATLIAAAGVCSAQVPQKMNYQVMLTDAANQPLASQSVQLVFKVYTLASGGSQLWTETQNVTTNSIGVVSVILGSVTPLAVDFSTSRWLQVEVNGETMAPRRELVAAPYARQAYNADNLGGTAAASFALSSTLSTAGTINAPANPVDWTKLKSVPAGFSDGVDNAGVGDGNSLDAPDGDPIDALYVQTDGDVRVGGVPLADSRMQIVSEKTTYPAEAITSQGETPLAVGVIAVCDSSSGIVGNADHDPSSYTVPSTAAGAAGIGWRNASGGFFYAFGDGIGSSCTTLGAGAAVQAAALGSGDAVHASASGGGFSGYFYGGNGLYAERHTDYPAMNVRNSQTGSYGDAAWFSSVDGALGDTWTLLSACSQGVAGRFSKLVADGKYTTEVWSPAVGAPGLYVQGYITSTGLLARSVETSRGTEPSFAVTASDVDVMASGSGRLASGAARVEFDRLFSESISGAADLRVTATPIGAWSAIYVERVDGGGFTLRSDAGDKDVEFNWVAVGRARDYERTPDIIIPDANEEARIAQEKAAAFGAHPPAPAPSETREIVTTSALR